ncbi:Electron transport complex protein RnfC, partial [Haemophilus influenzae]
NTSNIRK